jgi:hypothetical protein
MRPAPDRCHGPARSAPAHGRVLRGLVDEKGHRWCGFGRLAPQGVRAAFCTRIGRPADLSLLPVLGVALMR